MSDYETGLQSVEVKLDLLVIVRQRQKNCYDIIVQGESLRRDVVECRDQKA